VRQAFRRGSDAGVRVRVIDVSRPDCPVRQISPWWFSPMAGKPRRRKKPASCRRHVECPIVNISLLWRETISLERLADAIGGVRAEAASQGIDVVLDCAELRHARYPYRAVYRRDLRRANCRVLLDPWHLVRWALAGRRARPSQGLIGAYQLDDRTPPAPGNPTVPMTGARSACEGCMPLH